MKQGWIELMGLAPERSQKRVLLPHSRIVRVQQGRAGEHAGCTLKVRDGDGDRRSHTLMIVTAYSTVTAVLSFLTDTDDWIEVTESPSRLLTFVRVSTILSLNEADPKLSSKAQAALVLDDSGPDREIWILPVTDSYTSVAEKLAAHDRVTLRAVQGTSSNGPLAENAR